MGSNTETIREMKIKRLLIARVMSIGKMLAIIKSHRNKWEVACKHTASINMILRIAIALDVMPEYLIDDSIKVDEFRKYNLNGRRFSLKRDVITSNVGIDILKYHSELTAKMNSMCDGSMRNRGIHLDDILLFDRTVPVGVLIAAASHGGFSISDAFVYRTPVVTLDT